MSLLTRTQEQPGVTTLALNRPDKRNALSMKLMQELCSALDELQNERVIILRGEGPVFCAGLDLKETLNPPEDNPHASAEWVARTLRTLYHSPAVTIAAVHGGAIAGGAGVMSACDLVVAAEGTKIGYPETKRGLVAGLVMTFLRRQLREREARELLLVPDLIEARRALEMGLVNRVVEVDQLLPTALELASAICEGAPGATSASKRFLDQLWHRSVDADLDLAMEHHLQARGSPEAKEGINAFLEKRQPAWIG